jgi:hypothetical protein
MSLVAHCGGTTDGAFLHTFTLTDTATTWTECLPLLHRTLQGVVHALERARGLFPFPILGMDTDNGSDSINEDLLASCDAEHLTLTRGWQCDQNGRPHRRRIGVCSPRRTTLVHDDRGNRVASPSATVIRSSLC